ncbi:aminopeptidase [Peptoniphilus phoceensis]|uniref:aminopeptidase n=1 Tax=Peptoniphilus phoceensis TaxID=1720298 RepID=UPI0007813ABF|nr:leucyl aminopeptidase [Peptoniphilus phoceensis]
MKKILMGKIADKLIDTNLKMKKGEKLLIVTEPEKINIAEVIAASALRKDIEPVINIMMPREFDSNEPPKIISEAMKASDAFLSVVEKSITHTNAVKEAISNGSRGIVLTQFSEDMMIHGGMECDFEKQAPLCKKVASMLANSKEVHLTTPLGTDLKFSAEGRRGNSLYCLVEPGEFSTAPTIEANVSPIEGTAQGKIVADASVPYIGIGLLEEPIEFEVVDGFIVDIKGGYQAKLLADNFESMNDPNVYNIAELGIGLNPNCRFIGLMLEDEGVYGSVHIGIGTSINLGGTLKAACHYDAIMTGATVVADGVEILKNGKIAFDYD